MNRSEYRAPAQPWVDWINARLHRYERANLRQPTTQLAGELGVNVRELWRWSRGMYSGCANGIKQDLPADSYPALSIAEALARMDVPWSDVFGPDVPDPFDVDLEPDAHCPCCRETVTPIEGECPWCSTIIDPSRRPPSRATQQLGDAFFQDARVLRSVERLSFYRLAQRLIDRTPYTCVSYLRRVLGDEFKERGWDTRPVGRETRARERVAA